jgi:predicted HicB family RNase H-like nuclease
MDQKRRWEPKRSMEKKFNIREPMAVKGMNNYE